VLLWVLSSVVPTTRPSSSSDCSPLDPCYDRPNHESRNCLGLHSVAERFETWITECRNRCQHPECDCRCYCCKFLNVPFNSGQPKQLLHCKLYRTGHNTFIIIIIIIRIIIYYFLKMFTLTQFVNCFAKAQRFGIRCKSARNGGSGRPNKM